MKDKTKEQLSKALSDIQQKYDVLKASTEKGNRGLKKSSEMNEVLLYSLPHPAMYIRKKDRVIISANKIALDMGVKVGGHCWREFMKAEYISQSDKKLLQTILILYLLNSV
jgi:hypothetical protein